MMLTNKIFFKYQNRDRAKFDYTPIMVDVDDENLEITQRDSLDIFGIYQITDSKLGVLGEINFKKILIDEIKKILNDNGINCNGNLEIYAKTDFSNNKIDKFINLLTDKKGCNLYFSQ